MSINAKLGGVTLENVTQLPIKNKNNQVIATVQLEEVSSGGTAPKSYSGTFTLESNVTSVFTLGQSTELAGVTNYYEIIKCENPTKGTNVQLLYSNGIVDVTDGFSCGFNQRWTGTSTGNGNNAPSTTGITLETDGTIKLHGSAAWQWLAGETYSYKIVEIR